MTYYYYECRRHPTWPKITTTVLSAAGIDLKVALPPMYKKINCNYTRHLPSMLQNGEYYFNVEFTEHIGMLGELDIVGYDYGLVIKTLPEHYIINEKYPDWADGPSRVRVNVAVSNVAK